MTSNKPVRVFLVDDHEVVRRGLRELLGLEEDVEIVGEAATAAHGLDGVAETQPDVALLDVRLPDRDGIHLCREIRSRHPRVACLILTAFADDEVLVQATLAGAAGYLLKLASGEQLVDAIRTAASGRSLFEPLSGDELLDHLGDALPGSDGQPVATSQHELLELVAEGLSNREIAERIGVEEGTVRQWVEEMLSKLGVLGGRSGSSGEEEPGP